MLLACEPSCRAAYMNAKWKLHVDSVGKSMVADSARGFLQAGMMLGGGCMVCWPMAFFCKKTGAMSQGRLEAHEIFPMEVCIA